MTVLMLLPSPSTHFFREKLICGGGVKPKMQVENVQSSSS